MSEEMSTLLMGDQSWSFLWEVALRSVLSFLIVLIALRSTGKRGIRQLTLFEVVIILTLGSAAGDVTFYNDVGLIPVLLTIFTIIVVYRAVTFLMLKFRVVEKMLEGEPVNIIEDGHLTIYSKNENISFDEFFMELRLKDVEHLGQVRRAILETNGEVSVFRFVDEEIRPGLDICPEKVRNKFQMAPYKGLFSCIKCGNTQKLAAGHPFTCTSCGFLVCAEASTRYCKKGSCKEE